MYEYCILNYHQILLWGSTCFDRLKHQVHIQIVPSLLLKDIYNYILWTKDINILFFEFCEEIMFFGFIHKPLQLSDCIYIVALNTIYLKGSAEWAQCLIVSLKLISRQNEKKYNYINL